MTTEAAKKMQKKEVKVSKQNNGQLYKVNEINFINFFLDYVYSVLTKTWYKV